MSMKLLYRLAAALLLFGQPLSANQIGSAGRIEFAEANGGSCSAVLIRPNVIATAAHCAGDPDDSVVFRPGDGRIGQSYRVERFIRHPLYESSKSRPIWKLRFDIAIAELAEPVPAERADPLPRGDDATVGERLFLVSWRLGEGDRPRQRICQVIDGLDGLVTLGCAVKGGESGAPVLRKTEDGLELVAIISSRGRQLNQPVAQASNVRLRLQPLLDQLDRP